jgi:hypothetical protein
MNLEQFKYTSRDIEDSIFSDSAAQSLYNSNIKQRLIHKNSVIQYGNSLKYEPQYLVQTQKTAGVSLHDSVYGDISNNLIIAQNNEHVRSIYNQFNDAFSVSSEGVPQYLTTVWTTRVFEVITRAIVIDRVTHDFQQGVWGVTNIVIPVVTFTGLPALYSDYGLQGNTSINVNWINRQVVYFEHPLIYGDLTVAQFSIAKIDYINYMRQSVMEQIKLHQDAIGFYGYSENMQVFGLLNDPGLAPTIQAGIKAAAPAGSSQTLWQYATYFEIIADISYLYGTVLARAGGNVGTDEKCYLLVPPSVYVYLTLITAPLGNIPFKQWLKDSFPNLEIIQAPLLQGTGTPIGSVTPNQVVLIFDNIKGQPSVLNAYTTLYNSHGTVRLASSYQEKVSYGLAGVIITNPLGVQVMSGV